MASDHIDTDLKVSSKCCACTTASLQCDRLMSGCSQCQQIATKCVYPKLEIGDTDRTLNDVDSNTRSPISVQLETLVKDIKKCKSLLEVLVAQSREEAQPLSPEPHSGADNETLTSPMVQTTAPTTTSQLSFTPPQDTWPKNRSRIPRLRLPPSFKKAQEEEEHEEEWPLATELREQSRPRSREVNREEEEEIVPPPKGIHPFPSMYG